jgi:hypothetical protein
MSDPYRDSLTGLRERIRDLEREVGAREARTTEHFWHFIPAERAESLRALRAQTKPARDEFDELARAERALAGYLAAIDETIALAPSLERACRELPDAAPESKLPKRSFLQVAFAIDARATWDRICARLEDALARVDPAARLEQRDAFSARASFRAEDAPFALAFYYGSKLDELTAECWHVLTTGVAIATPRLRLAPELMGHWLLKPLRLVRDLQVDDPAFDGTFLIDADDPGVARALLGDELRAALLKLAGFDIPRLSVHDQRAELRWCFDPNAGALRAAARALAAIRRAPIEVRLLKD